MDGERMGEMRTEVGIGHALRMQRPGLLEEIVWGQGILCV